MANDNKKQKGRMRLLHEKEIEKDELTFDEYLKLLTQERKDYDDAIAEEAIPLLCTKAKREHPLMSSASLRMKVIKACRHLWMESTIRHNWPKWMVNEIQSATTTASNKRRGQKNKLETDSSSSQKEKHDAEREQESASKGGTASWDWDETHPKTEKSPMTWLVETNRVIARLFQLLTNTPNMPTSNKDIKLDIIKPTRPFIEDIVNSIPKDDRIFLHNWLVYLDHVIRDRIDIVEKADKTAYDTREDIAA